MKQVDVSKNETVFVCNKWYRIYGQMPLGDDIKYLLIPVVNTIWVGENNIPHSSKDADKNDISYGLWTNQLAINWSREKFPNGQQQLTLF